MLQEGSEPRPASAGCSCCGSCGGDGGDGGAGSSTSCSGSSADACACGGGGSFRSNPLRRSRQSSFTSSFVGRFVDRNSRSSIASNDPRMAIRASSPLDRLRKQIWITLDDPSSSILAKYLSSGIILVITISIVNFAVGSMDTGGCHWSREFQIEKGVLKCDGTRYETRDGTQWVETVCIIIFSAEYMLRLLCCGMVMPLCSFLLDPLNLLDLMAIMPWYITRIVEAVMSGSSMGEVQNVLGVLRIVRLTRILRVFKASKTMKMMLVLGRTMMRSVSILSILLFSSICMMVLFGALIVVTDEGVYNFHTQQYHRSNGDPSPFYSIGNAMYWCMTTMTTVGYGDVYPETPGGTAVGMICMLSGVVILSLPITVISRTFTEEFEEQTRITRRETLLAGLRKVGAVPEVQLTYRERMLSNMGLSRRSAAPRPSVRPSAAASSTVASAAVASAAVASFTTSTAAMAPSAADSPVPSAAAGVHAHLSVVAESSGQELSAEEQFEEMLESPTSRDSSKKNSRTDVIRKKTLVRDHADSTVVPGYLQCKWLLSDFSDNVADHFQIHVRKGEADLLRMSRQVLIRSRIMADGKFEHNESPSPRRSTVVAPQESPAGAPAEGGYGWQRDRAPAPYAPAPDDDSLDGHKELNSDTATSHEYY